MGKQLFLRSLSSLQTLMHFSYMSIRKVRSKVIFVWESAQYRRGLISVSFGLELHWVTLFFGLSQGEKCGRQDIYLIVRVTGQGVSFVSICQRAVFVLVLLLKSQ